MAHITADRVRDTTTSTGTGALTVSGTAPTAYRTFSAVCSTNDTFWYAVQHQTAPEWEVGLGTYSSANTITRTTVVASSNANAAVSFSAGTKDVFITLAAAKTVQQDASGNVGIGTTTPSTMLHVNGGNLTVTNPSYAFSEINSGTVQGQFAANAGGTLDIRAVSNHPMSLYTNNTERMRITSAGNVGIGTTTPSQKLDVNGTAAASAYILNGNQHLIYDGDSSNIAIRIGAAGPYYKIGTTGSDNLRLDSSSNGDILLSVSASEKMRITSSGNVGIGTTAAYGGKLNVVPATTPTTVANANQITIGEASNNTGYRLQIGYFNNGGAGYNGSIQVYDNGSAEDLILNGAGGNVGIGTNSPSGSLHVQSSTLTEIRSQITGSSGNVARLSLVGPSSSYAWYVADGTSNYLALYDYNAGSERMRIDSSGNVGIGTTSTSNKKLGLVNDRAVNTFSQIWSTYNGATFENDLVLGFDGTDASFGNYQSKGLKFLTNNQSRMYIDGGGNVGIGTSSPSASAALDITSTTQGVLFPRMTTTQRDNISSPADGLVLYNTTTNKLQVRASGSWVDLH